MAQYGTMQQGSTGNVLAAICSFFIPGLGQLVQGRIVAAAVFFLLNVVTAALMYVVIGFILWPIAYIWNIIDAARYSPQGPRWRD